MNTLFLLLGAAAIVAILHSILPDHWVPLAVVARTQRWNILRVARVSALASLGHVITSLVLAGIIALIGLQFQRQLDTQQGHIIGGILVLTGIGFLLWGFFGGGHHGEHSHSGEGHSHAYEQSQEHEHGHYDEHAHDHDDAHDHSEEHGHDKQPSGQRSFASRLSAIAVPFGVAASPDLTILPVALAAAAVGVGTVVGVLSIFAVITIGTFVSLTVLATLAGYQIKGAWLENNANTITSLVLIAIGIVAFIGF